MSFKLPKFCIFCGKDPVNKNMEHPIPKWLIKLTGDEHRIKEVFPGSKRPFSTFEFPSCTECNTKWGEQLETKASAVIRNLLNGQSVSDSHLTTLMDWFDKVRIGLWLANLQLSENRYGIIPKFHIASRIGLHDRVLCIYRVGSTDNVLDWWGTDTPEFHSMPSCFSIQINNLYFVSISYELLLANNFGLPYPNHYLLDNDNNNDEYGMTFSAGNETIASELMGIQIHEGATKLYQCMFPQQISTSDEEVQRLYNCQYTKNMSLDHKKGISRILVQKENHPVRYPGRESSRWLPPTITNLSEHSSCLENQVFNLQKWLMNIAVERLENAESIVEYKEKLPNFKWQTNTPMHTRVENYADKTKKMEDKKLSWEQHYELIKSHISRYLADQKFETRFSNKQANVQFIINDENYSKDVCVRKTGENDYEIVIYAGLVKELLDKSYSVVWESKGIFRNLSREKSNSEMIGNCQIYLLLIWFEYIFFHELAHINCGHLDVLGLSNWFEIRTAVEEKSALTDYQIQRLEAQADGFAILNMIGGIYLSSWKSVSTSLYGVEDHKELLRDHLLATFYLLKVFDDLHVKEGSKNSAHQPPFTRANVCSFKLIQFYQQVKELPVLTNEELRELVFSCSTEFFVNEYGFTATDFKNKNIIADDFIKTIHGVLEELGLSTN